MPFNTFTSLIHVFFCLLFRFLFFIQVDGEIEPLNYVPSQKGKFQLSHEGFYYVREKVVNSKVYWRCVEYTSKLQPKCHARIHTVGNSIVRSTPHCHEPIKAKKKTFWISDAES